MLIGSTDRLIDGSDKAMIICVSPNNYAPLNDYPNFSCQIIDRIVCGYYDKI
jgi:hypothetical protein